MRFMRVEDCVFTEWLTSKAFHPLFASRPERYLCTNLEGKCYAVTHVWSKGYFGILNYIRIKYKYKRIRE